jgi:hypothetical protein
VSGGSITFQDNLVSGNSIPWTIYDTKGGGLYLSEDGEATFEGDTFTDNRARGGGGLYLNGDAEFDDVTISNNEAGDYGGGLYVFGGSITVTSGTFAVNEAFRGAGMYLAGGTAVVGRATISKNDANWFGGGLYLSYSDLTLTNSLVADNMAGSLGSGLYVEDSSADLIHTTIASNGSGDGSGVYVHKTDTPPSDVDMTNTILVGHTVGVYVTDGNQASLEATVWGSGDWANDADWGGDGTIVTGTVNIWADPAFSKLGAGRYRITESSPAKDAGLNAGVNFDIDGQARPNDAGYDIGADEYYPSFYGFLPIASRND